MGSPRHETGTTVSTSVYGDNQAVERARSDSTTARRRKLRVVLGCGRGGDRGRGILRPTAVSAASVGRSAGLDCADVFAPLRLPIGGVKRPVDRYEDLIVGGDPRHHQSGLDRPASGANVSLPRCSAIAARIINRTWPK